MTITLLWNNGQHAAAFHPSIKMLWAVLGIFATGAFSLGLVMFAALAGVALVIWNLCGLLYQLLARVFVDDLFIQLLGLLLLATLLLFVIGVLIRYLAMSTRQAKAGA